MKKQAHKHLFGIFLALTGAILWGIDGITSQFLFQRTPVELSWLIGVKMIISGILLLAVAFAVNGKKIFSVWHSQKGITTLLIYTIFGLAGDQVAFAMAVKVSSAAMATILQSLSVILVVIYAAVVYHEFPNGLRWLAIVIATLGTWLLVTRGSLNHISLDGPTIFWGLTFAVCAALNNALPVKLVASYGSLPIMAWAMLLGGIIFEGIHPVWVDAPHITWDSLLGISFTSIAGTGLAYYIFISSLKYISPTEATVLITFEALTAVVGGFLFMELVLNWAEILGAVMILTATIVLALADRPTTDNGFSKESRSSSE